MAAAKAAGVMPEAAEATTMVSTAPDMLDRGRPVVAVLTPTYGD
jgi:hypothetical protein